MAKIKIIIGFNYQESKLFNQIPYFIKDYQNNFWYGGNSIYKENTEICLFDSYIIKDTITLDTLVVNKNYPLPDLIKIDSQGYELDIIKGSYHS